LIYPDYFWGQKFLSNAGRKNLTIFFDIIIITEIMKENLGIVAFLFFFSSSILFSATWDNGIAGSFLTQPAGARGSAIGEGYSSITDDSTAVLWNPSGISRILKPELNMSRSYLFEDTEYSFLAFSYPFKKSIGITGAYINQTSKGYEKRINPFDHPQNFSISNDAALLGMGAKINLKKLPLDAGITLKTVRYTIDNYSDTGFGVDIGLITEPIENSSFGLAVHNILKPKILLVSREIKYPFGTNLSLSYRQKILRDIKIVGNIGFSKYENQNLKFSFGGELNYTDTAFVRFGKTENGFSSGVGLKLGNYLLDYSAVFHEIAPINTISITIRFGITAEELEDLIKKGIRKFDRESASKLARVYFQQAEVFYKEKKYIQAIKSLENASLLDPYNQEISDRLKSINEEMDRNLTLQMIEKNRLLATEYYERGDYITSRQYWQSVLEIDPQNTEAQRYIEEIDTKITELEREKLKHQAEEEKSRKVSLLLQEASELLKNEKYLQAISKAKKVITISPSNTQALSLISIAENGLKLSIQKRLKEAISLCEKNKIQEGLKIIESILKEFPDNKEVKEGSNFCKVSWKTEISSQDRKKIEQIYYMAVDSYLKGKYKEAQKYIDEIYKIDPLNENAKKLEEKLKNIGTKE